MWRACSGFHRRAYQVGLGYSVLVKIAKNTFCDIFEEDGSHGFSKSILAGKDTRNYAIIQDHSGMVLVKNSKIVKQLEFFSKPISTFSSFFKLQLASCLVKDSILLESGLSYPLKLNFS